MRSKAGWDIPAVREQALNPDLPGEIIALVRQNVYDTATGKYLLIPQGARLVGTYDSRVAYGQDGIQVVWSRLIFPDGSSINLEGMAGQDASGRAGLRHDGDNHYKRLVGFGLLISVFSAAFQLSQTRRGNVLGYPSPAKTAGSAVGGNISQLGVDVTRRNLNIQPTIKVPIGYRFNVRVNRDILFESPYPATTACPRLDLGRHHKAGTFRPIRCYFGGESSAHYCSFRNAIVSSCFFSTGCSEALASSAYTVTSPSMWESLKSWEWSFTVMV